MRSVSKPHVVHLARWYPYRADPMFGLFVQKHVKALLPEVDSTVIFVWPWPDISATRREERNDLGFREICITFRPNKFAPFNWIRFFVILWRELWRVHRQRNVQLIHVHVLTRIGCIALMFKWITGVPYIITEHWTRYLDKRKYNGIVRKWATGIAVRRAEYLTNVSNFLQRTMTDMGYSAKKLAIVGNVVDFALFRIQPQAPQPYFVHVSTFDEDAKNLSGMIRTVAALRGKGHEFTLVMVGDGTAMNECKRLVSELKVGNLVKFTGVLTGDALAKMMAQARCYVQFSNYENMPVVISESLACGVPVISTQVGGIAEMVNDSCGILIPVRDEAALADAMIHVYNSHSRYDSESIRKAAFQKFSIEAVKAGFLDIYREVINFKF